MNSLDRVYVSWEQCLRLKSWWQDNYKNFNQISYPLNEGIIFLEVPEHKDIYVSLKFKKYNSQINMFAKFPKGEWIDCEIALHSGLKFEIVHYKYNNTLLTTLDDGNFKNVEEVLINIATYHAQIMQYMALLQPEFEMVEEPCMNEKRTKKAKRHNKYNHSNIIKLTRKVYKLNNPTYKPITKKHYTKIAQSWGVRGHFRNYKTGKTTWVKPYTKGNGEMKNKIYKVEVV